MDQIKKTSASDLPKFIIVDFGTNYRRPTFFPGQPNTAAWIPIHSITTQYYTKPTNVRRNCE